MPLLGFSVLSGLLCALVWRPPHPPWTLAFCFAPLWFYWMSATRSRSILLSGWIAQFVGSLVAFYWVKHTALTFFGARGLPAWLYLLGFASLAALNVPAVGLCWHWLRRRFRLQPPDSLLLLVLLATLADMVFPRIIPFSFGQPWLWSGLPVYQSADWIGFTGLSAVTYTLSAVCVYGALRWQAGRARAVLGMVAANLTIVLLASGVGFWHTPPRERYDAELRVHMVQSFLEPIEPLTAQLGEARAIQTTMDHHFSRQAIDPRRRRPDLVVWAETAMPFDVGHDNAYARSLQEFIRGTGIPLITGAYRYDANKVKYNSAVHFNEAGQLLGAYDKNILMPFGEYLPGEKYFPSVRKLAAQVPNLYGEGGDAAPFLVREARLGLSICYEALFPDQFRKLTRDGASVFLNISSDIWFGPYLEPAQGNALAQSRAIEFRRPLIRVGDAGVSSAMLADGRIAASSRPRRFWQRTVDVAFEKNPDRTFFDLHGNQLPLVVLAAIGLLLHSRRNRGPFTSGTP